MTSLSDCEHSPEQHSLQKWLCRIWRSLGLVSALHIVVPAVQATANPNTAHICEIAAQTASHQTGVPISVLRAISLTETGRRKHGKLEPWPWTVNMEGKGVWFDTPQSALEYVDKNFRRGARSFDVGCFQLNYKWHGDAFSSIQEMFDPTANAIYAANFLSELFAEKGNWADAAGAYHSRTPKYANRYIRRFSELHARLTDAPLPTPAPVQTSITTPPVRVVARVNRFPLLQGGNGYSSLGSLMPANAGTSGTSLFGGG